MNADSQTYPLEAPNVGSLDRFGFTLFVAVALHAIALLGVGFETEKPPKLAQTLEVTLAQFRSEKAPEKADYLAQQNQQGSGDSDKKQLPTTTNKAIFHANESHDVAAQQLPSPVQAVEPKPNVQPQPKTTPNPNPDESRITKQTTSTQKKLVTQSKTAPIKTQQKSQLADSSPPQQSVGNSTSLLARSLEIASLEAKLDTQKQALANKPKVRRLYSASTRESYDAAYLDDWRRKVERVGNINYPEEAHRRKLYGSLRMLVVIEPDGRLNRVEILKSSGHSVLDDAAKRIVHLSAPFASFSPEMRKNADLVEIIRTWRFEQARFGVNR